MRTALPAGRKPADAKTSMLDDPDLGGPYPPRDDPRGNRRENARGPLQLRRRHSARRRSVLGALAVALVIAIIAVALDRWGPGPERSERVRSPANATVRVGLPPPDPIIYDTAVLPIAPQDAKARNDARPNDIARAIPAAPFAIGRTDGDGMQYEAALQCLAQAVYYEAGSESDDGQRAVAQVILNRVRHPAFPDTVCGVVYQGSERQTGCQFTFTCDGSLARAPSPSGMARARRAAGEALAGQVSSQVGWATHYHADYVVPYWASSLAKVDRIGAHIFYNLRGPLGSPRAFYAVYDLMREPFTAPLPTVSETGDLTDQPAMGPVQTDTLSGSAPIPLAEDVRAGRLVPEAGALQAAPAALPPLLRADEEAGSLQAGSRRPLVVDERQTAGDGRASERGER